MKHFLTFFLLAAPLAAQSPDIPPAANDSARVQALIEQLGAPKVRLRDEAQTALGRLPEAEAALREAAASHPAKEVQLRAQRLLKELTDTLWTMESETHVENKAGGLTTLRGMASSPDGTRLAGMHRGGAEILKTETGEKLKVLGNPCLTTGDAGIQRSLAFSPDGRLVASTDHTGSIYIDDLAGQRIQTLTAETIKRIVNVQSAGPDGELIMTPREVETIATAFGLAFLPDAKGLLVFSRAGLIRYDLPGGGKQLLPLAEIFPIQGYTVAPRCFSLSPDRGWAALGVEVMGSKDQAALVEVAPLAVRERWSLPKVPSSIAVPDGGREVLVGLRDGAGVQRCQPGMPTSSPLHSITGWVTGLTYAADGQSAFLTNTNAGTPLRQIALPSGQTIWTAPPSEKGYEDVVLAGPGRIAISSTTCYIQVWKARQRAAQPAVQPSTIVR